MKHRLRFFNMYVTIFFSVSIVLFFIGVFCVIVLSAHHLVSTIKSRASFTVVMRQDADSASFARMNTVLDYALFCSHYTFLSSEETLKEYKTNFGDDPMRILGYNPFKDSYEVFLKPEYVHSDSVHTVAANLKKIQYVDDVIINDSIFSIFGSSFNKIIGILLIITFVLFLIAEVLIINTIRLQIYSKRFIISTMKLVGATSWKIKKQFLRSTFNIGIFAFLFTLFLLSALIYYCREYLGIVLFPLNLFNMGFVVGVIFFASILITTITSFLACEKYIKINSNTVYEI